VTLDGKPARLVEKQAYVLMNKPRGVLSTVKDQRKRRTVTDLLSPPLRRLRLYPVGRLDWDSEGLILLTNHGELAHRLMHPRFGHEREYRVAVDKSPDAATLERLRKGVELEEGMTAPADVEVAGDGVLRMVLKEGKKRQIRRMLEECGHKVRRLERVRLGGIELGALATGQTRQLGVGERRRLLELVGLVAGDETGEKVGNDTPGEAGKKPGSALPGDDAPGEAG
jgi:pseudouridine synthase